MERAGATIETGGGDGDAAAQGGAPAPMQAPRPRLFARLTFAPPSPPPSWARLPMAKKSTAGRRTAGDRLRLLVIRGRTLAADCWQREDARGTLFHFVPVPVGVGAAIWFAAERGPALPALATLFALLIAAAGFYAYRRTAIYRLLIVAALVLSGMIFAALETRRMATAIVAEPVVARIIGVVERRAEDGAGRWRYVVRVEQVIAPALARTPARIALSVRSAHQPMPLGTRFAVRAQLSPPAGPALPGLNDFAFSAYHAGIGANGFAYGQPRPIETAPPAGLFDRLARAIETLRADITERIRSVLPGDAGAFAAAMVTGEQRGLSREATEALRVSGLAHIVAVSGLNMALAAGLFFVGVRRLMSLSMHLAHLLPIKKWAAAGAILAAYGYYLISGAQVSSERAFLMTAIMLGAVMIDRPALSMRNLALAALVILAISPSQLMGPSFQMSFAATAALIAAYRYSSAAGLFLPAAGGKERPAGAVMAQLLPAARPLIALAGPAYAIAATSLIGGFSTAAFAAEHFQRLSGYSLAANLAAMPIVSLLVMPCVVFAMLLMPFGLDHLPLQLMAPGLEAVLWISATVAGWGGAIEVPRLPDWFLPLFVAGFVLVTGFETALRHLGWPIMALAVLTAAATGPPPAGELLIAENGALVGLSDGSRIATNRAKPNAFVFDQWRRALGAADHLPPLGAGAGQRRTATAQDRAEQMAADRIALAETADLAGPQRFACLSRSLCLATSRSGWRIATADDGAALATACPIADLIVAGPKITDSDKTGAACSSAVKMVDSATLRHSGALEIAFPDRETMVVTAAFDRLTRPWQIHRRGQGAAPAQPGDPPNGSGPLPNSAPDAEALSDSDE